MLQGVAALCARRLQPYACEVAAPYIWQAQSEAAREGWGRAATLLRAGAAPMWGPSAAGSISQGPYVQGSPAARSGDTPSARVAACKLAPQESVAEAHRGAAKAAAAAEAAAEEAADVVAEAAAARLDRDGELREHVLERSHDQSAPARPPSVRPATAPEAHPLA